MDSSMGLLGAFTFALGATIVFYFLLQTQTVGRMISVSGPFVVFPFIGFLLVGLGLWLIVQSGKSETKQPLLNTPPFPPT